jgi:hypothetical protein
MRSPHRSTLRAAGAALLCSAAMFVSARPAQANGSFLNTWQGIYPASSSDDNIIGGTGSSCALCHFTTSGGSSWNAYGWKIRQGLQGGQTLSNSILSAELLDSDVDPTGSINLAEIFASTQPGWTPGPNNTRYNSSGTVTGQNPPSGILGSLDPNGPLVGNCRPGTNGIISCPCGNPPSGPNRGCNNSSGTGGASITATGSASLAADTVVFTTAGERATATSILLQGSSQSATGVVYGQGVRCATGVLKRLFTKSAVGGSITVPNFGAGDPTVSARSAAKGDVIAPGNHREYMVYYRDPTVLGSCPATSTFNGTDGGTIIWAP